MNFEEILPVLFRLPGVLVTGWLAVVQRGGRRRVEHLEAELVKLGIAAIFFAGKSLTKKP